MSVHLSFTNEKGNQRLGKKQETDKTDCGGRKLAIWKEENQHTVRDCHRNDNFEGKCLVKQEVPKASQYNPTASLSEVETAAQKLVCGFLDCIYSSVHVCVRTPA